jgi:hypothetical protein
MRRNERAQRTPAPVRRATSSLPTSGFALIVDNQPKAEFKTQDQALKAGIDLKQRFKMLQVKIYDAETGRTESIELAAA